MRKPRITIRINIIRTLFVLLYLAVLYLPIFEKVEITPSVTETNAGNFVMQTGGYTGKGNSMSITGLGFAPDLVIVKPATTAGIGAIMKTTAMIDTVEITFPATANGAGGLLLDSNGFSVMGTNTNSIGVYYTWVAFGGSDCTSTGNFCVGAYVGNGSSPRLISTVGFQPDLVIVKPSGATVAMWRSSSMADGYAQNFSAAAQDTSSAYFTTLAANGFNVGASLNTASTVYYYVAFKGTSNAMSVGYYDGSGAARNIDLGYVPDFVFLKNSATTDAAIFNTTESWGKTSYRFADTAILAGGITGLISTPVSGFSVDTNVISNGSGNRIYWVAFGGASETRNSSGTFKMAKGTYTGTGTTGDFIKVDGLNFTPDLVIVKGDTTQVGVFRTSTMPGDYTTYFSTATASFAGGIVSLDTGGFTIGSSAVVNTSGATYYWEAFGNAWNEKTNSGATDFYVGSYLGSANDGMDITKLPFGADLVVIKSNTTQAGAFRTSSHLNDISSFFGASAEAANVVQALNTDGFEIGTHATVNSSNVIYHYFGFSSGSNFTVGSYNGSGASKDITTGFQPDYIWVKHPSTTVGVDRSSSLSGDGVLPFTNLAKQTSSITAIIPTGFTVLSSAYVNTGSVNNYRYVAWRATDTVGTPTFKMQTGGYVGKGTALSITGLGFAPDLVLLKPTTNAGVGAIFRTTAMIDLASSVFVATANGAGDITLDSDGFTVMGANSDTSGVYYTWIAFGGSDCSSTGSFCVGAYVGNGTSPRLINTVGFQPDLVWVKPTPSTAVSATWHSSSMPDNYAQYFTGTIQETGGAFFTTFASNGFNVGASNNVSAVVHYYVAFKNVANAVSVGYYDGSGAARNIDVGYEPDFVFLKNSATTSAPIYNTTESFGKSSPYFTDTATLAGGITDLITTPVYGFSVDTNTISNGSGNRIYWAAFGGATHTRNSSGTFKMAKGTYTGTGTTGDFIKIDGLDFTPDLVIVKGDTAQIGVFRSATMPGDSTAYLRGATANFTGGIVNLETGGFTIGASAVVNTSGATYYWEAFGNAWNEKFNTGASDFYVGSYQGSANDDMDITKLPFGANMVAVKSITAAGAAIFRTSSHVDDLSSYFGDVAESSNVVQALNSDGFKIGTNAAVNTSVITYHYFGFRTSANFAVGSYNGSGASKDIAVGFQPDYVWVKHPSTTAGVDRSASLVGDGALPFTATASQTSSITAIIPTGFTVLSSAYVNTNSVNNYRYVAWRIPAAAVISITVSDGTIAFGGVPFGTSKSTISLSDTQSVTNNGNRTVTVSVKGYDTACPWTLASTTGSEQYKYEHSIDSGSNWYPISKSYTTLKTGLAASTSQNFDLQLWAPTVTSCLTEQTASVTLLATEE